MAVQIGDTVQGVVTEALEVAPGLMHCRGLRDALVQWARGGTAHEEMTALQGIARHASRSSAQELIEVLCKPLPELRPEVLRGGSAAPVEPQGRPVRLRGYQGALRLGLLNGERVVVLEHGADVIALDVTALPRTARSWESGGERLRLSLLSWVEGGDAWDVVRDARDPMSVDTLLAGIWA